MKEFALVAAGGAAGACARYALALVATRALGGAFPWSTLAVNVSGGFAMGLLAAPELWGGGAREAHLLLGVGLLGGFTTFSAFSIETVRMIEGGHLGGALAYMLASVTASVGAAAGGLALARALAP